ncbi:MAG: holo-ACP synthase [Candidatus Kariarchaeaceae archaeon]
MGIGTDIIEVHRMRDKISSESGFKESIFTTQEIEYCETKKAKYQHYAGRYAAKEAFFKAIGSGWRYGMKYKEIEIVNDNLGKPEILVHGTVKEFCEKNAISNYQVSLSHVKEFATAVVLVEKSNENMRE